MGTMAEDKHNKFYKGTTPWIPTPNADDSIFHTPAKQIEYPLVRSFTGTLEIGFSIGSIADINVSALLKIVLSFAMKPDPDFRILPLTGKNQSIAWLNGIPP
jgi:hypothetical protein